jgi:hypothetical protein
MGGFGDVRPIAFLAYEQMFASTKNSSLAQRTLGALRLTRSFLLLEDDYDVDWEVDQDERVRPEHPHRAALGLTAIADRLAHRRPGEPERGDLPCLCPVGRTAPTSTRGEGTRASSGRVPRDLDTACVSPRIAPER